MDKLIDIKNIKINNNTVKSEIINNLLEIHEKYIYLNKNKDFMSELQIYRFICRMNLYSKNIKKDKILWNYYINYYYRL